MTDEEIRNMHKEWHEQREEVIKRFEDAGIKVKKNEVDGRKLKRSGIVGKKREKIYIDA